MKKLLSKVLFILSIIILCFVSCSKENDKKDEKVIENVSINIGGNETIIMPETLYNSMANEMKKFESMFNSFSNINKEELDNSVNYFTNLMNISFIDLISDFSTDNQESLDLLREELFLIFENDNDVEITVNLLSKLSLEQIEIIDSYKNVTIENIDVLLFVLQQVYDFENGDNWFASYEDIFNAFIDEDSVESINLLNKYFSNVELISSYNKIEK